MIHEQSILVDICGFYHQMSRTKEYIFLNLYWTHGHKNNKTLANNSVQLKGILLFFSHITQHVYSQINAPGEQVGVFI